MSSKNMMQHFGIGDACEVYSNSRQTWHRGEVIEENKTKRGLELTVIYRIETKYAQKRLCINSQYLRKIDITNDENSVYCVCGEKMRWMFAKDCYPKQQYENSMESKDNITNKSSVECDGCSCTFGNNEQLFHCPKATSEVHKFGSDLCYQCAMHEACDESIQNIDIDDTELKDNDTIARELGNKPFAEGTARYAYLGLWQVGKKKGTRCVIKRYKDKHLIFSDGYDADIKCSNLAAELVKKWNELNLVSKTYEVIVPIIARKTGKLWELCSELLILLALLGLEQNDISHILDGSDESGDNNAIASGEVVLVEDYLKGDFMKWNSNSGWYLKKEFDVSVQAFCHWTYHYSNGEYLFCDAQGVKRATKYILTDPAILSNTDQGGRYGVTDCGKQYLLNWFRKHKCNDFCDKNWKKPSQMEIDSVPQHIRRSITRATTFNVTKLIKSNTLGSQSISQSRSTIVLTNNGARAENDGKQKEISLNKYKNKEWMQYDQYLSWQNGERIVICSKVILSLKFNQTNKKKKRLRERILLLSSYEKLYLINPTKGFDGIKEFSKNQVQKVELKFDKSEMILHFSTNKVLITLIDVVDHENDAKTWKHLIDINMRCN